MNSSHIQICIIKHFHYNLTMAKIKPIINPKNQSNEEIVAHLLVNDKRQYTEASHAEIYRRLISTIESFNLKAEKTEKVMLILAFAQVLFAVTQILLAIK